MSVELVAGVFLVGMFTGGLVMPMAFDAFWEWKYRRAEKRRMKR